MWSQVHAFLPASSVAPSLAADRGASGGLVLGAPDGSQEFRGGLPGRRRDGGAEPPADDPLRDEIFACSEVGEVLDIVQDEADTGLPPRQVCRLLVRVAALARQRKCSGPRELQALAADPAFDQLLQLVEERVYSFTAKARWMPRTATLARLLACSRSAQRLHQPSLPSEAWTPGSAALPLSNLVHWGCAGCGAGAACAGNAAAPPSPPAEHAEHGSCGEGGLGKCNRCGDLRVVAGHAAPPEPPRAGRADRAHAGAAADL